MDKNISKELASGIEITGHVVCTKNGKVIFEGKNLVVEDGIEWIANRLDGTGSPIGFMAVGTSSTGVDATDTTLGTEEGAYRPAISSLVSATTYVQVTCVFDSNSNTSDITINELGLFDSLTGGIMISRLNVGGITKQIADVITFTWTLNITALAA